MLEPEKTKRSVADKEEPGQSEPSEAVLDPCEVPAGGLDSSQEGTYFSMFYIVASKHFSFLEIHQRGSVFWST